MKVLLGVTGSVAAINTPKLIAKLKTDGFDVRVMATERSLYFWDIEDTDVYVLEDRNEWPKDEYERDDPVLHIELRKWADVLLIAPLSANTLAKIANGLSDNLLTSVARAWDRQKSIILAPAMNTFMWEHPATGEHLAKLKLWHPKLVIVDPVVKVLACGDKGMGAMAEIQTIVREIHKL